MTKIKILVFACVQTTLLDVIKGKLSIDEKNIFYNVPCDVHGLLLLVKASYRVNKSYYVYNK